MIYSCFVRRAERPSKSVTSMRKEASNKREPPSDARPNGRSGHRRQPLPHRPSAAGEGPPCRHRHLDSRYCKRGSRHRRIRPVHPGLYGDTVERALRIRVSPSGQRRKRYQLRSPWGVLARCRPRRLFLFAVTVGTSIGGAAVKDGKSFTERLTRPVKSPICACRPVNSTTSPQPPFSVGKSQRKKASPNKTWTATGLSN